jgi:cyanate permease
MAGGARVSGWTQLGLGWLIYFSFGMVMSSLVPIVTILRDELSISYTEMGVILGAWQLVYIAAAAPSGLLIDCIGPKKALVVGALIIALSGFLRTQADGFWTLFLSVSLFGLGGPIVSIGLPKLVADWFASSDRGLASGIYITGPALGSVLVLSATHALVLPLTGSWRVTIALYALVALIVAILWIVLGRDSPASSSERDRAGPVRSAWREVAVQPAVWGVIIVGFSAFLASHGLRSWLPQILETRGMSPAIPGVLASLPALTGVLGSILILRLAARGAGNRRRATLALLAVTGACVAALSFVDGWLLMLVIALEGFCAMAIQPLMLNIMMEMPGVGPRRMGTAAGIFFAVGEVGGTLGPVLLGLLVDVTGSFTPGLLAMAAIMWVMLLPALRIRA